MRRMQEHLAVSSRMKTNKRHNDCQCRRGNSSITDRSLHKVALSTGHEKMNNQEKGVGTISAVPSGLMVPGGHAPTLKRWAILKCPSGTGIVETVSPKALMFTGGNRGHREMSPDLAHGSVHETHFLVSCLRGVGMGSHGP